jgi:plastocyanin
MKSHPRRILTGILALVFALPFVACGDDDPTEPEDGPFTGTIRVLDNRFSPANVTISAGDSVTWRWEGNDGHTVTHGTSPTSPPLASKLFDTPERTSGTFGFRFNSAGSFPYFCRPHLAMGMSGTITVQP